MFDITQQVLALDLEQPHPADPQCNYAALLLPLFEE